MREPINVDPVTVRRMTISTAIFVCTVLYDLRINRLFFFARSHAFLDLLETNVHALGGSDFLSVCNLDLNCTADTRTIKHVLCGLQSDRVLGCVLEEVLDLVNGQVSKADEAETCGFDYCVGVLLHNRKLTAVNNTHRRSTEGPTSAPFTVTLDRRASNNGDRLTHSWTPSVWNN